jgi:hypothetical protein
MTLANMREVKQIRDGRRVLPLWARGAVDELSDDLPVPDVALRLRCSACGSRKVATRPTLSECGPEYLRTREGLRFGGPGERSSGPAFGHPAVGGHRVGAGCPGGDFLPERARVVSAPARMSQADKGLRPGPRFRGLPAYAG